MGVVQRTTDKQRSERLEELGPAEMGEVCSRQREQYGKDSELGKRMWLDCSEQGKGNAG